MFILFLFFVSNISFITFRWGRPEAMLTLFALVMLYLFQRGIQSKNKFHFFTSGLTSGILFLTHPVSAILLPPTLCVLYLLTKKPIRNFTIFSAGFISVLSLGLLYLLISSPHYLIHELIPHTLERFALTGESPALISRFNAFISSYSLGVKRGYILVFEVGILLFCISRFKRNRLLATYAIWGSLALFLGILLIDPFRRRYFGIILIFSLICLALLLQNRKQKISLSLIFTIGIYALNSLMGNLYLVTTQFKNTPYKTITAEMQTIIPTDSTVLSPIELWLTSNQNKTITNIHHFPILNTNSYQELQKSKQIDYVIYSQRIADEKLSPTTGHINPDAKKIFAPFFNFSRQLILNGTLVHEIDTIPYGKIQIYKLK